MRWFVLGVFFVLVACSSKSKQPVVGGTAATVQFSPLRNLSTRVDSQGLFLDIVLRGQDGGGAVVAGMIDSLRLQDASGALVDGLTVEPKSTIPEPGLRVSLPAEASSGWYRLSFEAEKLDSLANRAAFFWTGTTGSVWLRFGEEPILQSISRCGYADGELVWTFQFSEPVRYGSTLAKELVTLVQSGAELSGCRLSAANGGEPPDLALWEGALSIACPGTREGSTDFSLNAILSPQGTVLRRTQARDAVGKINWESPSIWKDVSCDVWFEDTPPVGSN